MNWELLLKLLVNLKLLTVRDYVRLSYISRKTFDVLRKFLMSQRDKVYCIMWPFHVCYVNDERYGVSKYAGNVLLPNGRISCGSCYCHECSRVKLVRNVVFCNYCNPEFVKITVIEDNRTECRE